MKKAILFGALATLLLGSCSLLQRHDDGEEQAVAENESIEGEEGSGSMESEVSRLNTKIAALETKLDVLTSNMERMEMHRAQPVIEAQPAPQPTMAAPVEEPSQISAAPSPPSQSLPTSVKEVGAAAVVADAGAEKEFRAAMVLFQNGKNMEAASRFALVAKKFPQHLLASHSLYWAGEASARGQQWSLATENWEELEKRYPRSAYVPEALAGLARAYETQGEAGKAKTYRDTLLRSFPKSPVVLSLNSSSGAGTRGQAVSAASSQRAAEGEPGAPVYDEETSEAEGQ